MAKKKIKFFIPSARAGSYYLPVAQYVMKLACDLECKNADQLIWQQSYFEAPSEDYIWQSFVNEPSDIVCLSLYLWNNQLLHWLAKKIKKEYPNTLIIVGGPDIMWKTHEDYVKAHPEFDYIVYGDGEEAFPKLMDSILTDNTSSIDLMNIPNLIFTSAAGKIIKTRYETYRNYIYKDHSAWLHSESDFRRDAKKLRDQNIHPAVAWESDRGCPYDCSFCDWSSGLHHKITKKNV